MVPGLLYRSARPDESSLADRAFLRDHFGIRTIIDLRTTTEHKQQQEKREQRIRGFTTSAECLSTVTGEEIMRPLRIPGIDYSEINFNGSAYSRFMIAQLDWLSFLRLLVLLAIGRRLQAISILGSTVMKPRGLAGLAVDSLEVCRAEIKAVFDVLADESRYPILVHCTQGKDRTGLVVMLVLMLLTTPAKAVQADYMRTSTELIPEREEKLVEIRSIGLTEEFADCDPDMVSLVHSHINDKYGNVETYLEQCGVCRKVQRRVRDILAGKDNDQ
jgi:protein tyrosine/serine phosphatase